MIERAIAGFLLLAVALLAAYGLGRAHGGSAELERWEEQTAKVVARNSTAVARTNETTREIEQHALPELAAHKERAVAREKEAERAIAAVPILDDLRLPDDLRRVRDAQLAESRRVAEAPGAIH